MSLTSRVPTLIEYPSTPEQAWSANDDGDLEPSFAQALEVNQGWQLDNINNLQPTDSLVTADSFWELDGNSDVQPKA